MSYRMRIDPRASKAGRFIARVHKEIQRAFAASGMSQQELAQKLDVNRATVNKRLLGQDNLTLRSIADLAWGVGADIEFRLVKRDATDRKNYQAVDKYDESGWRRPHGRADEASSIAGFAKSNQGGTSQFHRVLEDA